MPLIARARQSTADLVGERLAELERPLPHALMADDDAARGQHFLNHAQAEREAKVQPYRVADHLRRETVASIAGANGRRHPIWLPALLPIRKPASSQVDGALTRRRGFTLRITSSTSRAICRRSGPVWGSSRSRLPVSSISFYVRRPVAKT